MTPDGAPLLGPPGVANVAQPRARLDGLGDVDGLAGVVADRIAQREPEIDLDGLTLTRYRK